LKKDIAMVLQQDLQFPTVFSAQLQLNLAQPAVVVFTEKELQNELKNCMDGFFETILFYKKAFYLKEHLNRLINSISISIMDNKNIHHKQKNHCFNKNNNKNSNNNDNDNNTNGNDVSEILMEMVLSILNNDLKLDMKPEPFRLNLYSNSINSYFFKITKLDKETLFTRVNLKFIPNVYKRDNAFFYHKNIDRSVYQNLTDNYFNNGYNGSNSKGGLGEGCDILIGNEKNEICETTISNIFFVKGNSIFTPYKYSPCLPGIMRNEFINNFNVKQTNISIKEITSYDFAFLTNSLKPIQFVPSINNFHYNFNKYKVFLSGVLDYFKSIKANNSELGEYLENCFSYTTY